MTKSSYLPESARITAGATTVFATHRSQVPAGSHTDQRRPPGAATETEKYTLAILEVAGLYAEEPQVYLEGTHLALSRFNGRRTGIRAFHQLEIYFGEFFHYGQLTTMAHSQRFEARYHDSSLAVHLQ